MKPRPGPSYAWMVSAAAAGFVAGMVVMAALFTIFPAGPWPGPDDTRAEAAAEVKRPASRPATRPVTPPEARPVTPPQTVAVIPSIGADPVAELRGRRLELPVQGAQPRDIHDMFNDTRGGERRRCDNDVVAAPHTPVIPGENRNHPAPFHPHRPGTVHHDLGHLGVSQKGGQRAEPLDAGDHPVGQAGTLGAGEQWRLPHQRPVPARRVRGRRGGFLNL